MSTDDSPMFMVRVERGRKPRVYRVDPLEVIRSGTDERDSILMRRQARAWWITVKTVTGSLRTIGAAAVADSVEKAHGMIAHLTGRDMKAEGE